MEYVEIKKVGKVVTGNTPSKKENKYYNQNYIEFVKPSNFISGKITNIKKGEEYLSYEGMKKGRTANKGDVLVTCIGNIGNVGIVEKKVCFNQQINAIKCNENYINNKYLANVIRYISPLLTHMANKAVVPILNKTQLENIKIPIFPKETQEEIANILEIIQKNIDKRKEQLLLADKLIKSRFIEMFGDLENSTLIGDVCTIKARIGWQGLSKKEYLSSGEYRLVTGVDFNNGRINFENCYYVNKERYEQDDNIKIKVGDVLVTKDGTIGKVAIVDKLDIPATLNSGVFVLRSKDSTLNNVFLVYSLLSEDFKRFIKNIKIGATVPHLNQSSFVKHKIKLPPVHLQNEFSQFVEKTNKLKFEAEKSLKEMENLYDSLMQKFFKQN